MLIERLKLDWKMINTAPEEEQTGIIINYLKINIFPDGGISRVRAFGQVVK